MTTHATKAHLLGLSLLSLATTTVSAQSLLSQYGEVVQTCGGLVPGSLGLQGAVIDGSYHGNLDNPTIDLNGTVLFHGRMAPNAGIGLDDNTNRAYFLGRANGDLQIVVRSGDQAPGCPPGTLLRTSDPLYGGIGLSRLPRISPQGEILFFQCSLHDPINPANTPTTSDRALFWGPPGGLLMLAREGDQVPFLPPGITYDTFTEKVMGFHVNASGRVLFNTTLGGASAATNVALVTGTPGNLTEVLRKGDPYPFGGTVVTSSIYEPLVVLSQINEVGQVLHDIKSSSGEYAIAVWTAGTDVLIARTLQQAPGLPAGVVFATDGLATSSGTFNKLGNTVIEATLAGTGVNGTNDHALYTGGSAGLSLVLRRGGAVPGLPGVTWGAVDGYGTSLNDAGQMAFVATLGGTATAANDTSIWMGSVGNLTLIAREGDVVPGMAPGGNGPWKYGNINIPAGVGGNAYLNQRGGALFQNTVTDGVATRKMWFGYTPKLGIVTVLDGTDTVLGANWTIASTFGTPNSSDATPAWFTNNGDFVCKLVLGSPATGAIVRCHLGSFVAEPSSVPVTGGVPQDFHIDCGPAHAFQIYIVLATSLGTRPGFPSPLGGGNTVPLNWDPLWTQLSFDLSNTVVWTNTLGFTDAAGKGMGASGFLMPPGYPGFVGTTLHHAAVLLDFSIVDTFVTEPSALKLY